MAEVNHGTDWGVLNRLDPSFPMVKGRRALAYKTFRRVTTDPALGIFDVGDEPACMDLTDMLNEQLDPQALGGVEKEIGRVCAFDPQIDTVVAAVKLNESSKRFEVRILLTPADGSAPFPLVISIDGVNSKVLNDADLG